MKFIFSLPIKSLSLRISVPSSLSRNSCKMYALAARACCSIERLFMVAEGVYAGRMTTREEDERKINVCTCSELREAPSATMLVSHILVQHQQYPTLSSHLGMVSAVNQRA